LGGGQFSKVDKIWFHLISFHLIWSILIDIFPMTILKGKGKEWETVGYCTIIISSPLNPNFGRVSSTARRHVYCTGPAAVLCHQ
jgi:hypothetical protein